MFCRCWVKILKMKFDKDLCLYLQYDFGKMNSTLGSVVPLAMFLSMIERRRKDTTTCLWISLKICDQNTDPIALLSTTVCDDILWDYKPSQTFWTFEHGPLWICSENLVWLILRKWMISPTVETCTIWSGFWLRTLVVFGLVSFDSFHYLLERTWSVFLHWGIMWHMYEVDVDAFMSFHCKWCILQFWRFLCLSHLFWNNNPIKGSGVSNIQIIYNREVIK